MAKPAMIQASDLTTTRSERSAAREPGRPLNFRVPDEFNRRFRRYAFEREMKLTDVLMQAFNRMEKEDSDG